jgi:hypothetical protein
VVSDAVGEESSGVERMGSQVKTSTGTTRLPDFGIGWILSSGIPADSNIDEAIFYIRVVRPDGDHDADGD